MGVTPFQKNPEIFFKSPEIDPEYFWVCTPNWSLLMQYVQNTGTNSAPESANLSRFSFPLSQNQ